MARYKETIPSPKPVEEVFAYMADFTNITEWDPTAEEAHVVGAKSVGEGATFHVEVKFAGRTIPLDYETTEYERPRRVVLRAENSTTVSEDVITVSERAGGGSDMTYDANLSLKGPLKLFDPVLGVLFKRLGDGAAEGLRRRLG